MSSPARRIAHHASLLIARNRRNPVVAGLARGARLYLQMFENRSYWFDDNGERWLLNRLAGAGLDVVFDVGANVGDWTGEVRTVAPQAQIHAFEIVPDTAESLRDRFAADTHVHVAARGLYDRPGTIEVNHYPDATYLSGTSEVGEHPFAHVAIEVPVVTGDQYCADVGVDRIDYLKVDAEGADHKVLAGFERMFAECRVEAVQFEYGYANIAARYLLADHYEFFSRHGMVVGKLYPDHVAFRDYDPQRHEDFIGPNMVAVRRDRTGLIDALSG